MKVTFDKEIQKNEKLISKYKKGTIKFSKEIKKLQKELLINNKERIIRSIKFSTEHKQAGISILSYFSEIVEQRYPNKTVSIKIEQDGMLVRLCIETEKGDKEIIEKTLNSYGSVVTELENIDKLLENPIHIAQLENKLEMAKLEIKANERLFKIQHETIHTLRVSLKSLCKINSKSLGSIKTLSKQHISTRKIFLNLLKLHEYSKQEFVSDSEKSEIIQTIKSIEDEDSSIIDDLKNIVFNTTSGVTSNVIFEALKTLGFV